MTMLITLDEAKAQLSVDYEAADDQVTFYIHAASAVVLNYLKDARYGFTDTSGEVLTDSSGAALTPPEVKLAVLVLIDEFFKHRGSDGGKEAGWNFAPPPVVIALLHQIRDPAYA